MKHSLRLALCAALGGVLLISGCPGSEPTDAGLADAPGLDVPGVDASGRDVPATPDVPGDAPVGPVCGDGSLDEGEDCDDGNTDADDGCDVECLVEEGWSCDSAEPTACNAVCADGLVVGEESGATGCDDGNAEDGDGCSAACMVEPGFSCAGEPSACMTGCGDGIVAGTEACDDGGNVDLDGCSSACAVEEGWECDGASPSACTTVCGDGIPTGLEACDDGNDVTGDGCDAACAAEPGYSCDGVPSVCATTCGDGVVAGNEGCDDGNDVSFDGCHRGCISETEREPNEDGTPSLGGTGPQGNDFDATAVANADRNGAIVDAFVMGAAFGVPGDEDVFAYRNESTIEQSVTFAIFATRDGLCPLPFDPALTIRDAAGAQLARDDNGGPERCPVLTYVVPVGATVYVHVTEFGDNGTGDYVLSVALCTDGVVGGSEACDDGNTTSGDGCDNNCSISACGNGIIAGTEVCDDGNTTSGDGCDGNCVPSGCGNGVVAGLEVCDDGNATSGDGCDSNCTVSACGNGVIAGAEVCDDGNTTNGDGCDNDCDVATTCGNGTVQSFETCDDGARVNGDGCDRVCAIESGYACTGTPSVCGPICGDGRTIAPEVCDDGNTVGGDACEADCRSSLCSGSDREPNGTRATASCLNLGVLATGQIDPTGDQDFFTFQLTDARDVRVESFDASGTACPTLDTVVTLYDSTGATILNDDNDGLGNCSLIDPNVDLAARNLPAGRYYVRVRLSSVDATGSYTFRVNATPAPVCGDGFVSRGETCDDANTASSDGCSASCALEPGFVCSGTPTVCRRIQCGDGFVDGTEQCDDGNTADGDGCTAMCRIEFEVNVDGAGLPLAIPDDDAAGLTSSVAVTGACTVAAVSVTMSVAHTWAGDLRMELVSPAGTRVVLSNLQGGSSDLAGPYTFFATGATWPGAGVPIASGTYAAGLGLLNGTNGTGTWQLVISDNVAADLGTLNSWRLSLDCL